MANAENISTFYAKGKDYWEMVPATIDGMLGGFSEISNIDIQASARFLNTFLQDKKNPLGHSRAIDCGAGIGRITKHFLLKIFDIVDMVEQSQRFLDHAREYIGSEANRVDKLICCGLQDFVPEPNTYDVVWCQWVTGHLTNDHFITFLKRCKASLRKNGVIVIKDNLSSTDEVEMDNQDSSVTRPRSLLLKLFKDAGLELLAERKQYKFPKGLYEVKMFALR
ncbi:N-terminal Xaa-Pro-Lys N-methyltransferase 1-B-like isoform X2 [Centruroides sculpturatus]|nr:N-terminal Xaa-Pro-Lys N-methyltransferase 1-B-like isoform X2 [Centruroides sculpturatus]